MDFTTHPSARNCPYFNALFSEVNWKKHIPRGFWREQLYPNKDQRSMEALPSNNRP
jgi:hypothetical protein